MHALEMQTQMMRVVPKQEICGQGLFLHVRRQVRPAVCEMRRSFSTSKLIRIEGLCQPSLILANSFGSHLRKEITGLCKKRVPPSFRLQLGQHPCAERFLVRLRQFRCLGNGSLKQSTHTNILTNPAFKGFRFMRSSTSTRQTTAADANEEHADTQVAPRSDRSSHFIAPNQTDSRNPRHSGGGVFC